MDLRYSSINNTGFTISIRLAGFFIAKVQTAFKITDSQTITFEMQMNIKRKNGQLTFTDTFPDFTECQRPSVCDDVQTGRGQAFEGGRKFHASGADQLPEVQKGFTTPRPRYVVH